MRPIRGVSVANLAFILALILPQVGAFYEIHCPDDAIPGLLDQGTLPCYLFEDYPTQYATAEQRCRVNGGHLASIHDAFTNTFIAQVGDEAFGILKVQNFWIGANRLVKGKSWTWIDGTPLNYTQWAEGEPKSGRSQCASIALRHGQWKAESCLEKKRYVCEIPPGSSSTSTTVPAISTTSKPNTSSATTEATEESTRGQSTTSRAPVTASQVTKEATTASEIPSEAPSTTKVVTDPVVTTEKQRVITTTPDANTRAPSNTETTNPPNTTEAPLETTMEGQTEAPTTTEAQTEKSSTISSGSPTTTPKPTREAKTTAKVPSTSGTPTTVDTPTTTTRKASIQRSSAATSVTERQTKSSSPEETPTEVTTKKTTEAPTTTEQRQETSTTSKSVTEKSTSTNAAASTTSKVIQETTTERPTRPSTVTSAETGAPVTTATNQGTTSERETEATTTSKAPTKPTVIVTRVQTTAKSSSASVHETSTATTTRASGENSWICDEILGACYLVIKSPLGQTWSNQRDVCLQQESDLASIHSLAENDFVAHLISGKNGDAPLASIGLHADGESAFAWTDGTNAAFSRWDEHEPKKSTGSSCAVLDRVALNHWRSLPCDDKRFTLVCKKPFGAAKTTKHVATTSTKVVEASTTAPVTAWVSCPDASWTYDKDTAACYKVYDDEGTWAEHRERCQKTPSADLASIHSNAGNSFISDLALDADEPILSIGLTKTEPGSEFSWSDGTVAGYSNWDGQAPTGKGRCAVLSAVTGGKWKALPCEDLIAAFVCEVKLAGSTTAESVTTMRSQSTHKNSESTPPPTAGNPNECDSTWARLESTGTCYKVQSSPHGLNWTEQRVRCIEEGSDLASVHSAAENAFVSGLARQAFEPIVSIGLRTHSGKYEWSDGTKIAYTNWESEKPNTNGQCTVLTTIGAGQWQSIPCDTVQFAYVCKKTPNAQ